MARIIDGNTITDADIRILRQMQVHAAAYESMYNKLSDGCKTHAQDVHTLETNIGHNARWIDQNTQEVIEDILEKGEVVADGKNEDENAFSQSDINTLLEKGDGCEIEDFINDRSDYLPCCYLGDSIWLLNGDQCDMNDVREYLTKQPGYRND